MKGIKNENDEKKLTRHSAKREDTHCAAGDAKSTRVCVTRSARTLSKDGGWSALTVKFTSAYVIVELPVVPRQQSPTWTCVPVARRRQLSVTSAHHALLVSRPLSCCTATRPSCPLQLPRDHPRRRQWPAARRHQRSSERRRRR